jgi:integrase
LFGGDEDGEADGAAEHGDGEEEKGGLLGEGRAEGCPWITTHILRHTFASQLPSKGVSILKIAMWLGENEKTAQLHYAKLLPGDTDIEKAFGDREEKSAQFAVAG